MNTTPSRRHLLITGLGLAGLAALPAMAQDKFPSRPITLVVPFPPGGSVDIMARQYSEPLSRVLGVPIVVENRAGAGGSVGAQYVARSKADGYTLVVSSQSSHLANPLTQPKIGYDPVKDFENIAILGRQPNALVVHSSLPFKTFKEFIDYAKKNPGKLNYGTPGAGSTTHLGAELLKREAGFEMQHIAMKGSAPAHTELMGGRLDLVVDPFLSILPYVQGGRMKIIATMGDKRVAGHNYPTVAETIPGFNVGALLGFVAPAGTPKPVLQKIQADTAKALATPDVQKRAQEFGLQVVGSTPEQFDAFIASEMKRWGRIVTEANIQQE